MFYIVEKQQSINNIVMRLFSNVPTTEQLLCMNENDNIGELHAGSFENSLRDINGRLKWTYVKYIGKITTVSTKGNDSSFRM